MTPFSTFFQWVNIPIERTMYVGPNPKKYLFLRLIFVHE